MSDTDEKPRKYRKLSDIYKEYEPIRGVGGAKRKTPLSKGSGKRGRKTSLSVRCEASTSGTKKGSLSRGRKKGTEIQNTEKNDCSVSAHGMKKVQLALPIMTLSQYILTSSNDEIIAAFGLLSFSNEPPASGPGLPESEPIEPETLVCIMNRNPSEFCTEIAKNYMRSGYPSL